LKMKSTKNDKKPTRKWKLLLIPLLLILMVPLSGCEKDHEPVVIIKNRCITIPNPPKEVLDKLSEVKTEKAVLWVNKLDQLYEKYGNKKICPETIKVR
jgi:hypothetical protein